MVIKNLTAGGAMTTRTRKILNLSAKGGMPCPPILDTKACNARPCPPPPACKIGPWSAWNACSENCGWGQRTRSRSNSGPEARCGSKQEQVPCHLKKCPPQPCVPSKWATWSACSKSCGEGVKTRRRSVATAASGCFFLM